jgi:hypothetical protein
MRNLKTISFFFLAIAAYPFGLEAQTGRWKSYMAYQNATIVAETPNLVFAVYDGSLVSYNPEDKEIRTYTNQEGLHDTDIQYMVYSPAANALVLVYANANIDIFVKVGDVYNLPFLKNNTFFQDKTVYNLELVGDYAYLSTAFGIVVIDVVRKEIKDTYNLGVETKSVCQKGDQLYAATMDGLKKASVSSNLLDRENWKNFDETAQPEYLSRITKIVLYRDHLAFIQWNSAFYISGDGLLKGIGSDAIRQMCVLNDQLVLTTPSNILFYSGFEDETRVSFNAFAIDCRNSKNVYWLGLGEEGVAGISKQTGSSEYAPVASEIKINSPKRNITFQLKYTAGKLLVVGGGRASDRFRIPGTLMVLEDKKWFNFDEKEIAAKTGLNCWDFMSVEVDPADPNHYYVGSWGEGLYEFKNNEFINLYSYKNSSLQTALPDNDEPEIFVRVDGLTFDKQNNLFMVNGGVTNGLSAFINQKEWKNYYYQPIASGDPNKILISSKNQKWLNLWRGSKIGILVVDDNNTLEDTSDDKHYYSNKFVDQQGMSLDATGYYDMAEDHNGSIWVGTDNGPIRFSSAEQVGNGVCYRDVSTDQYGENFHLLEGLKIMAIAVDGGNRKWMGTDGSGVFVVDQPAGSNTIQVENYTMENSFLISNQINSIAINHETGEVFIATDKGLCSYMGEAIAGKADYSQVYALPNPVHPIVDNQVVITGLMQNSTVKITDLSGNLIKEAKSLGGQFIWDCRDRRGTIVKAGVYLVFAATSGGNQGVVTKIMVIN